MQRSIMAAILWTSCFSLTGCGDPERIVSASRPDLDNPDRLVCVAAPAKRPERGDPHVIDWGKVLTVAEARIQHDLYVKRESERNAVVAGYVLEIEGRLFACSNNAQWWRDYWAGLPAPEQ